LPPINGVRTLPTRHYGHSLIIDPWGAIKAEVESGTGVIVADLDMHSHKVRKSLPSLRHDVLLLMMVFRYDQSAIPSCEETSIDDLQNVFHWLVFVVGTFIGCMRAPCTCATAPAAGSPPQGARGCDPCVAVATAPAATQYRSTAAPQLRRRKAADVSRFALKRLVQLHSAKSPGTVMKIGQRQGVGGL